LAPNEAIKFNKTHQQTPMYQFHWSWSRGLYYQSNSLTSQEPGIDWYDWCYKITVLLRIGVEM
jgi:hypothetical protein